ncbi:spore coat protein [Bacillota bacterium LX-D]|nr:spore coat protein [Bacillota bacterium LX-D]
MSMFMKNVIKESQGLDDEVIANNMLASAKVAANAYLNAAMICATPELRAMYSASLNQIMAGQTAVMELAVREGWENPYMTTAQQLSDTYSKSQTVVESR